MTELAPGGRGGRSAAAPHATPLPELLARLGVDPEVGLAARDASERLAGRGPNELAAPSPPSRLVQILRQVANPIVGTLVVAALVAVWSGARDTGAPLLARWGDATAIVLIVVLNATLGYVQERRAESALRALQKLQSRTARVVRDAARTIVPARELVVGDVIEVEAGDAVPADARLVHAADLTVDESALTGESVLVSKAARAIVPDGAPLGDRVSMLYVGTSIAGGRARAIVTAVAAETELGTLSTLVSAPRETKTPLESRLDAFGKRVLVVCAVLAGIAFGCGVRRAEEPWHVVLLGAVSLAVAAVPEGLPAITSMTLALGVQRMSRRGAIVRKLAAVEALGSATVVCTDKTGTLTRNEMTVREVHVGGARLLVSGAGYGKDGAVVAIDGRAATLTEPTWRHLVTAIAIANDARLVRDGAGSVSILGDPTEAALLALAEKAGLPREACAAELSVVRELPFDGDRKRMSVVTIDRAGERVVHTKGAIDTVLPCCARVGGASPRPMTSADRAEIARVAAETSGRALRVLAVARRVLPSDLAVDTDVESDLDFLGLVAMADPPRDGAREAVRACRSAGVRVVMITGDHAATAIAIAAELGIWEAGAISMTGAELEALDDAALAGRIDAVRVFARVTAEQKLRIVGALRRGGHVVAMTGDGVNDAPALRAAHIGIAMGRNGTDVAREAADMVLVDDDFATIVVAIHEGRAIWQNIRKFVFFLLSSNAGLVVAVLAAAIVPSLPPLRPVMILWINLVTNGLPALALGVDPPLASALHESPRPVDAALLSRSEYLDIVGIGTVMGLFAVGLEAHPWAAGPAYGRALAFSFLALAPLFHALSCRSPSVSVLAERPSRALLGAVLASAALHGAALAVPALRTVLSTFPLPLPHVGVLVASSVGVVGVVEIVKAVRRSRAAYRAAR